MYYEVHNPWLRRWLLLVVYGIGAICCTSCAVLNIAEVDDAETLPPGKFERTFTPPIMPNAGVTYWKFGEFFKESLPMPLIALGERFQYGLSERVDLSFGYWTANIPLGLILASVDIGGSFRTKWMLTQRGSSSKLAVALTGMGYFARVRTNTDPNFLTLKTFGLSPTVLYSYDLLPPEPSQGPCLRVSLIGKTHLFQVWAKRINVRAFRDEQIRRLQGQPVFYSVALGIRSGAFRGELGYVFVSDAVDNDLRDAYKLVIGIGMNLF